MTLKQAFTMWACSPRNTALAANSRAAVQKVLLRKFSDVDLEQFTPSMVERLFRESSEVQEVKTKAASILVYLLQWGGDHGHCQRPLFDYTIANTDDKARVQQRRAPVIDNESDERDKTGGPDVREESAEGAAKENRGAEGPNDGCHKGRSEEKSVRGARKVSQSRLVSAMDPETLEVVRTFATAQDGCRFANVKTIDRAMKTLTKAGGYYWTRHSELKTFKERLEKKQLSDKRKNPRPKMEATKPKAGDTDNFSGTEDQQPRPTSDQEALREAGGSAVKSLKEYSDQELRAELESRGWHGQLSRTEVLFFRT